MQTTTEQVQKPAQRPVVYPIGYNAEAWDDAPASEPVKLCRLEDPTCEACQ